MQNPFQSEDQYCLMALSPINCIMHHFHGSLPLSEAYIYIYFILVFYDQRILGLIRAMRNQQILIKSLSRHFNFLSFMPLKVSSFFSPTIYASVYHLRTHLGAFSHAVPCTQPESICPTSLSSWTHSTLQGVVQIGLSQCIFLTNN